MTSIIEAKVAMHIESPLDFLMSTPTSAHPFWNPELVRSSPVYKEFERGPFLIRRGTLDQFKTEEIAAMVVAITQRYLSEGLFGQFPIRDEVLRQQLFGAMSSDFSTDRLVVMVHDVKSNDILGGCMVSPGRDSSLSIKEINETNTVLPTLAALKVNLERHQPLAETPEENVTCFTRFYREPKDRFQYPEQDLVFFSQEVLSSMAIVTQEWSDVNNRQVTYGLLDTHDNNVANVLTTHYNGYIVDECPIPTNHIMSTPLAHHYRLPGIRVIAFKFSSLLERAQTIDYQLESGKL